VQRAFLHQNGCDRAATAVETRLDDRALRVPSRVRLQLEDVGLEEEHLEQLRDSLLRLRRDRHDDRVAAPLFRGEPVVAELLLHALGVRARLVDLVDGDDDRHLGRARVVDRLDRLGHDPVVGRDDEHDEVGHLGAASAHRGECLVTRRVEERDRPPVDVDGVRADVLGDPARLAGRDVGRSDRVEERRLAVVDVAHDRDHGRARHEVARRARGLLDSSVCSTSKATFSTW
jgi:hypothetical protein